MAAAQAARDATGPVSRFFVSQRMRLHYVDWGNPEAPPLLLVHGWRDHSRSWDWVAPHFTKDWHVIAPDLQGHGDSQWSGDGNYSFAAYIYDLAQLIHQLELAPVTILAHSLGGEICLRYTGLFPDNVRKIAAIEGLGMSPRILDERGGKPIADRMRGWVDHRRSLTARPARRYASVEEALHRMQEENKHLSDEQARHLTHDGVNQNEDGTYSWKFDPYLRSWAPYEMTRQDVYDIWARITCPTLLIYGKESDASNPTEDGRFQHFKTANLVWVPDAGHWVHHDQLDILLGHAKGFL